MTKIVIFDYDDTLVRAKEHHLLILRNIYNDAFLKCEPQLAEILPLPLEGLYDFLVKNECENGTFEHFKENFYNHEPDKTEVFAWVPSLLEKLKSEGFQLIICSNNDLYKIEANLKRLDLFHYFQEIITLSSGFSKAKSNILRRLSNIYNSKTFYATLIGDSSSDYQLAQNSGIPYIDIKEIALLEEEERLNTIINSALKIDVNEKPDLSSSLILSQYSALRQELLNYQESEEKTYSTTLLATGTIFSALLTIIFTKSVHIFSGLAFIFPGFYTLTSLSKYITNGLRVSNISSFIAINYGEHFPPDINWELKISQFSSNEDVKKKVNLNSAFETAFVYKMIICMATLTSLIVSTLSFFDNFVKYAILNFSFKKDFLPFEKILLHISNNAYPYLSLLDLIGVCMANYWLYWLYKNKINDPRKRMPFEKRRSLLNKLWADLPKS